MKRSIILGAALVLAPLALAPAANAGDLSGYFGNTVVCKYDNGDMTKVTVNKDGSFKVVPTGHPEATGNWTDDGSTICYHQTSPALGPNEKMVCNSSEARKVGDSWAVTDPMGGHCAATLTAGQ